MRKIFNIFLSLIILIFAVLPSVSVQAATESQGAKNANSYVHDGLHSETKDYPYVVQKITVTNRTVTQFTMFLQKVGEPTGTLFFRIWEYGTDEEIGNLILTQTWLDVSSIAVGGQEYTITLTSPIWLNGTYRIGAYSNSQTTGSNAIVAWYQSTDVKANEYFQRWHSASSEWEGNATWGDLYYSYTYTSGGGAPNVESVIATGTGSPVEMSLSGLINTIGSGTVTVAGFEWGTPSANYTSNLTDTVSISANQTLFYGTATNLTAGITYFWRALGQNSAGIGYGGEESFLMGSVPLVRITRAYMNISDNDLRAEAIIDSDGGSAITSAGVYFSTVSGGIDYNAQPLAVPAEGEFWQVVAEDAGIVNTRYFARAYALTGAGIAYSYEVMFIAGKSSYDYSESGTGVPIIGDIATNFKNWLSSLGLDNFSGYWVALFALELLFSIPFIFLLAWLATKGDKNLESKIVAIVWGLVAVTTFGAFLFTGLLGAWAVLLLVIVAVGFIFYLAQTILLGSR